MENKNEEIVVSFEAPDGRSGDIWLCLDQAKFDDFIDLGIIRTTNVFHVAETETSPAHRRAYGDWDAYDTYLEEMEGVSR